MKSNLPLTLFCILVLISCKKITKEKIYGSWKLFEIYNPQKIEFDQLYINSDTIITIDEYLFPEKWNYKISQNVIQIQKDSNYIKSIKFERLAEDSIWIEGNKYIRTNAEDIDFYELTSLETNKTLEKNFFGRAIHLYNNSNQFTIRCATKKVQAKEIFHFIYNHSTNPPKIVLFLGKNIRTKDLIEVYSFLFYNGIRKVSLVTNKNTEGEYKIINDRIDLWLDQVDEVINKYKNEMPPPIPFRQTSKQELLELGIPVITINKLDDLRNISYNYGSKTILVSINSDLSIKEYLIIKMKLQELRSKIGINFWTEFI